MTEAEFEAYMKREITDEERDARLAHFREISAELAKVNAESPLPDDSIDYCKGRKLRQSGRAH